MLKMIVATAVVVVITSTSAIAGLALTHAAFAHPEISRRRNRSVNAMIATQMKRTHAKTMRMSQRTFKNGYDVPAINIESFAPGR